MPIDYIYIHIVWSTKNRDDVFSPEGMVKMSKIIDDVATKNKIFLLAVNGYKDHIHCLVQLKRSQSLSSIIKQLKGSSSFIYNKSVANEQKIKWQRGAFSESIQPKAVEKVINYIRYQEHIHRNREFKFLDFKRWG